MADEVVQGLNDIEVAKWTRQTVADGSWMQKYTLDPLSARDVYLANAIDNEIEIRTSADNELQDQIDTLAMSTDVIDVWGTWDAFTAGSGKYFPDGKKPLITDNDKVLNDEHTIEGEDVPSGSQTYWLWHKNTGEWEYVGYLNPYYSKSEIDTIINDVYGDIDEVSGKLETLSGEVETISGNLSAEIESLSSEIYENISAISGLLDEKIDDSIEDLSGTISSNYYKKGSITTGKNIDIVAGASPDNPPTLTISTKDDVSFTSVSATGFSGTNISASDGSTTATIKNLITSAEGGSAANAWIENNTTGNSAKYALSAEKVKWESGTVNTARPIAFAYATQDNKDAWENEEDFYSDAVYDSGFNYNPYSQQLNVKYISANTVSANLSGTADKATSAAKAEHTQDVITSYYATESQAGTQTATFNVSSLKLSGNKTAGVEISKSTNNNVDYLYFKLNSATVCNYVEDQNKYVKYTDTELIIGNTSTLTSNYMSTALGNYASASNYSFVLGLGDNSEQISIAENKGIIIGDSNTAAFNSYVIGHSNSASGNNDAQNKFILGANNKIRTVATNDYIIGNLNSAYADYSFILGMDNRIRAGVENPTFIVGRGADLSIGTGKVNIVLGSYPLTINTDTNLFVVGNGYDTSNRHNLFELADTKMTLNTPDMKTEFLNSGINVTYLGTLTGGEDINYGFIPYRAEILKESGNVIHTSAIEARTISVLNQLDNNVNCDLMIDAPSCTKSTNFRIKKFEYMGSDWDLFCNIHSAYEIRMNSCPGSGNTSTPVVEADRWVSGWSDSYSQPSLDDTAYSGYINDFNIIMSPPNNPRHPFHYLHCKYLHTNAYIDVSIDATLKIVTLIKGGLGYNF